MNRRTGVVTDIGLLDQTRVLPDDIFAEQVRRDPVPYLAKWRDHGPFYATVSGVPSAVFMDTPSIREIYRDWRRFSSTRPDLPQLSTLDIFNGQMVLTYCDPPEHNRLRRVLQPAFTTGNVGRLESRVAATVDELLSRAAAKPEAEAVSELCQPLATTAVLGHLLGVPTEGHGIFEEFSASWELLAQVPPGAPKPATFLDACARAREYCSWLVADVEVCRPDGLVAQLVRDHRQRGAVTADELSSLLMTVLTGGLGTIASLCALGLVMFGRHRDQWALLVADPSLVPGAVEEVLRVAPPGFLDFRRATVDTEVNGLRLWPDMPVYISQAAPGLDPALVADPSRFDVTRVSRQQFYFGEGAHRCIGAPLARTCARSLFSALARRYPGWCLTDPDSPVDYHGTPGERAVTSVRLLLGGPPPAARRP